MTAAAHGVRILGSGSAVPDGVLTNADLEKMVDTSDEWIVQRTGIRERRISDPEKEGEFTLARDALKRALDDAGLVGRDLDLVIHASVTSEMTCPSNACRIVDALDADPAAAFDLLAACSGFVYALNVADTMIRGGRAQRVGVIGCDALSTITDFKDRSMAILFGDAAGAVVLSRDDDPSLGCIYQSMGSESRMWRTLYIPRSEREVPEWDKNHISELGKLRMQGREVFKFAVNKFRETIEDALEQTGLAVDDVSQFVCHQSNARIIKAAVDKLGLPEEKVHVNIDRYGNCSSGSAGIVFDEVWKAGKIKQGDHVVLVAFGGGLTWASSVWKV
jgi:3-oxoacyl-[acyl-carrier-protein] synthase-3